jgi:hypothetical protein
MTRVFMDHLRSRSSEPCDVSVRDYTVSPQEAMQSLIAMALLTHTGLELMAPCNFGGSLRLRLVGVRTNHAWRMEPLRNPACPSRASRRVRRSCDFQGVTTHLRPRSPELAATRRLLLLIVRPATSWSSIFNSSSSTFGPSIELRAG